MNLHDAQAITELTARKATDNRMTTDAAIDTLAMMMQKLATGGIVVSGKLQFIRPAVPGLVESEVTFTAGVIPEMTCRTVRRTAITPAPPSPVASGETCIRCGGCRLQQTGTCKTCLDCGEAGGCG